MRKIEEGDILAGRYQLRNKLGSGGFSEVWRALDKKTGGKDIALKIYSPGIPLDEAGIDVFKKEYNISSQLIHSHIVVPNHFEVHEGAPFMVMPFMPNGTSVKYVRNWNEFEIKRFLKQTASALNYIHTLRNPVIHRDIKPENVLVNADGDFMLADFGISGEFAQTLRKSKAMESANACTLAFCPPEKYSSDLKQRVDRPSNDIWSLGASIFELITGETPFGENGGLVQASGAELKKLLAAYREARVLVEVGAYVNGSNPDVDRAIALMPRINAFLRQPTHEVPSLDLSHQQLLGLVGAQ